MKVLVSILFILHIPVNKKLSGRTMSDEHNPLILALHKFWQEIVPPQPVLVAVSGGPDSLALLHSLLTVRSAYPALQIVVAHFNHLIRGERAEADADFVAEFCRQAGVPCELGQYDVPELARQTGLSLEDAARQARYAFLRSVATRLGLSLVLVAHNADDQAETLLLRLLRGTGPKGLAGMGRLATLPSITEPALQGAFPVPPSSLQLGRPFLTVWRHEIETYCRDQALTPRHDETNDESDYQRNRVRHELLPLLETAYQPAIKAHLVRLAHLTQADQSWLDDIVAAEFTGHARLQSHPYRQVSFDPAYFAAQPLALQRRLVRQSAAYLTTLYNLDFAHVEAVISLWQSHESKRQNLPGGLLAYRRKNEVGLNQISYLYLADWPITPLILNGPGILDGPANQWRLEVSLLEATNLEPDLKQEDKYHARLDYAKIGPSLLVRPRRRGERFRPLGAPGRRKVQDVMLDAGLPRELRDNWPLVVRPAQANEPDSICWIPGVAVGEDFKLDENTRTIYDLRFTIYDLRF